jgi:hypothetical protein
MSLLDGETRSRAEVPLARHAPARCRGFKQAPCVCVAELSTAPSFSTWKSRVKDVAVSSADETIPGGGIANAAHRAGRVRDVPVDD